MSFAKSVESKIDRLPAGVIFSADTLKIPKSNTSRQTFSRLVNKEAIRRVVGGQGLYYKPKKGLLGEIKPTRGQVLEAVFQSDSNSYLAGVGLYNKLGLTTQVTGLITIATNGTPQTRILSGKKIKFIKARTTIRNKSIPLLQLLDALTDLKKIPDTLPDEALLKIMSRMDKLEKNDLDEMAKLACGYPKRTVAMLGAILENLGQTYLSQRLKNKLNLGTEYKMNLTKKSLPNLENWNIK